MNKILSYFFEDRSFGTKLSGSGGGGIYVIRKTFVRSLKPTKV
jgi:mevalonate kinase